MPNRDVDLWAPGDPLSSAHLNDNGIGKISKGRKTSDSAGTTTVETQITTTAVTKSGREIEIHVQGRLQTGIPSQVQVRVDEDGVQIARYNIWSPGTNGDPNGDEKPIPFHFVVETQPSAASHSYSLITGVSGSSGATCKLVASSDAPALIAVYDVGPTIT